MAGASESEIVMGQDLRAAMTEAALANITREDLQQRVASCLASVEAAEAALATVRRSVLELSGDRGTARPATAARRASEADSSAEAVTFGQPAMAARLRSATWPPPPPCLAFPWHAPPPAAVPPTCQAGNFEPMPGLRNMRAMTEGRRCRDILRDQVMIAEDVGEARARQAKILAVGTMLAFFPGPLREKVRDSESGRRPRQRTPCLRMLHPENIFLLFWNVTGLGFSLYILFAMPFYLSFGHPEHCALYSFHGVLDAYFILDIAVTFLTGYVDKATGVLVMTPARIAKKYLSGSFWIDLFGSIPWDMLHVDNASSYQMFKVLRHIRMIRMMKAARLLRLSKFRRLRDSLEVIIEASPSLIFAVGAMRVVIMICSVTHWGACAWHFVGMYYKDEGGKSWVQSAFSEETGRGQRYLYSLYFTLTTMTTVGYGDIVAHNLAEVCFVLVLLLIASIVFAALMGVLLDLISTLNSSEKAGADKRQCLNQYKHWRAVPHSLFLRIRNHLVFQWAVQGSNDSFEQELRQQLPPVLRKELFYHIYGPILRSAPFLAWMHEVSLKHLASMVETVYLADGDYVFYAGQKNEQVYILRHGVVRLSLNQAIASDADNLGSDAMHGFVRIITTERQGAGVRHAIEPNSDVFRDAALKVSIRLESEVSAARKIQRSWRAMQLYRPALEVPTPQSKLRAMCSKTVVAPAHFGEACLWVPFDLWDTEAPPLYQYTVRCESTVDLVHISRAVVQEVVQRFSPWQRHRLDHFRQALLEALQAGQVPAAEG